MFVATFPIRWIYLLDPIFVGCYPKWKSTTLYCTPNSFRFVFENTNSLRGRTVTQTLFALFDSKTTKITKELITKTQSSRNRISQNNLNEIRFSWFALEKH